MSHPIKIILYDDVQSLCETLAFLLSTAPEFDVVGSLTIAKRRPLT